MASHRAYPVGGLGYTPTVDDVVKLALDHLQVSLDPAGKERVKKASPAPKNFQAETLPAPSAAPENHDVVLTEQQFRAALAVKLLQLMNGRSGVRLPVAEYLTDLLNNRISLHLGGLTDAAVLSQLADACHGSGQVQQGPLQQVLQGLQREPPLLSSSERVVLQGGAAVSAGVGTLVVQAAKKLLSLATATAALSFEAVGAQVKCLEADLVESQGSVAAANAADEMRGLLEGSKRVGTLKAAENDSLPAAFSTAPQRLGALSDSAASAYTAVRAEVQCEALPPKGGNLPGNTASPRLAATLLDLAAALLSTAADANTRAARVSQAITSAAAQEALAAASSDAAAALTAAQQQVSAVGRQLLAASTSNESSDHTLQSAIAAEVALRAAHSAISQEALVAAVHLRLLEGTPAPAALPEADGNAVAAADGDKKADKKADKKKGKGGAAGVVLGKGAAILRAAVEAAAAASTGSAILPIEVDGEAKHLPAAALQGSLSSVRTLLQPLSNNAAKLLDELKAVVEANQARRKPKVPKGARDFLPDQMAIREAAFNIITSVFKRHGAVAIDTPVFELRETLMGKYGEDSKLIYDLADQGGEVLSLRYDLTVPFARYVAVNGIGNIKRYHIGKVYRRDQPQMNRGRFREFFQCDFDIAGAYPSMVADAEVVKVLVEILSDLKLGEFEIKLNHRKLLDAMMEIAGVPPQKFRAICSAIDKLDKEEWADVKNEMVEEKGLPEAVADRLGEFVKLRGEPLKLLDELCSDTLPFTQNEGSKQALEELRTLFTFLEAMGALRPVTLDLSLARGLDYYTGLIYEAVLKGANVGSIAAGGRYDNLVGMFSGKDVPAVGVSIGIERVFSIMEKQVRDRAEAEGRKVRATETQVLVASIGNNMQVHRMKIAAQLWTAGIKAEFGFKANPKMGDQLNYVLEETIPFMVLFGDEELNAGNVKIKNIATKAEDTVALANLVDELKQRIATL